MPTKEHVTHQEIRYALELTSISTNTTTAGAIFDTADYDMGIYFAMLCTDWTDGAYTLLIEDGDDAALSDAATVAQVQYVYARDTGTMPVLGAATVEGAELEAEGIHSTKRYVRASIVSTGTTTGADLALLIVKDAELLPVPQA